MDCVIQNPITIVSVLFCLLFCNLSEGQMIKLDNFRESNDDLADWFNQSRALVCQSGFHLAKFEEQRIGIREFGDVDTQKIVHAITWETGEPEEPFNSAIGCRPYRPDEEWPTGSDNRPLHFLGQFNFENSKDLFDFELPGDVMLVFCQDLSNSFLQGNEGVYVEWWSRNIVRMPVDSIPKFDTALGVPQLCAKFVEFRVLVEPVDSWEIRKLAYPSMSAIGPTLTPNWFLKDKLEAKADVVPLLVLQPINPHMAYPFNNQTQSSQTTELKRRHQNRLSLGGDDDVIVFAIDKKSKEIQIWRGS